MPHRNIDAQTPLLWDFHVEDASEESGPTWSVRFAEDEAAPIVIDAGTDMYDQQVEEQMAAAAALVRKLRFARRVLSTM